jgi:hypothetical protein
MSAQPRQRRLTVDHDPKAKPESRLGVALIGRVIKD